MDGETEIRKRKRPIKPWEKDSVSVTVCSTPNCNAMTSGNSTKCFTCRHKAKETNPSSKKRKEEGKEDAKTAAKSTVATGCVVCGKEDNDPMILLCDGCDAEYHMYCLIPPLSAVPEDDFYCPRCIKKYKPHLPSPKQKLYKSYEGSGYSRRSIDPYISRQKSTQGVQQSKMVTKPTASTPRTTTENTVNDKNPSDTSNSTENSSFQYIKSLLYKGVYKKSEGSSVSYAVRNVRNGVATYHGAYKTEVEAAIAYDQELYRMEGPKVEFNFPALLHKWVEQQKQGHAKTEESFQEKEALKGKSKRYRGVSLHGTRYQAQIVTQGKAVYLGSYISQIEAARVYDRAAAKYHGKEAMLNFPGNWNTSPAGEYLENRPVYSIASRIQEHKATIERMEMWLEKLKISLRFNHLVEIHQGGDDDKHPKMVEAIEGIITEMILYGEKLEDSESDSPVSNHPSLHVLEATEAHQQLCTTLDELSRTDILDDVKGWRKIVKKVINCQDFLKNRIDSDLSHICGILEEQKKLEAKWKAITNEDDMNDVEMVSDDRNHHHHHVEDTEIVDTTPTSSSSSTTTTTTTTTDNVKDQVVNHNLMDGENNSNEEKKNKSVVVPSVVVPPVKDVIKCEKKSSSSEEQEEEKSSKKQKKEDPMKWGIPSTCDHVKNNNNNSLSQKFRLYGEEEKRLCFMLKSCGGSLESDKNIVENTERLLNELENAKETTLAQLATEHKTNSIFEKNVQTDLKLLELFHDLLLPISDHLVNSCQSTTLEMMNQLDHRRVEFLAEYDYYTSCFESLRDSHTHCDVSSLISGYFEFYLQQLKCLYTEKSTTIETIRLLRRAASSNTSCQVTGSTARELIDRIAIIEKQWMDIQWPSCVDDLMIKFKVKETGDDEDAGENTTGLVSHHLHEIHRSLDSSMDHHHVSTVVLYHPSCVTHQTPIGHPECPERMKKAIGALDQLAKKFPKTLKIEKLNCAASAIAPSYMTLLMVHSPHYLEELRGRSEEAALNDGPPLVFESQMDADVTTVTTSVESTGAFTNIPRTGAMDTYVCGASWDVALIAAGTVCLAVDKVVSGEFMNAVCLVRPPGHHVGREGCTTGAPSSGFCLLNNVVIGAVHARLHPSIRKVAVVDWDIHHGNGTEELLKDDQDAFFASVHLYSGYFFPGTGDDYSDANLINVALRNEGEGSGSVAFRNALSQKVFPALEKFSPDIIFISAGFDGHRDDILGGCAAVRNSNIPAGYVEEDYSWATREILRIADRVCHSRVISVLEGGYDVRNHTNSLAKCIASHIESIIIENHAAADDDDDAMLSKKEMEENSQVVVKMEKK